MALICVFMVSLEGKALSASTSASPLEPSVTPSTQNYSALRKAMPMVRSRRADDLNHLYQFEPSLLAGRTPVMLLPGRAEEFQRRAWWKKIRKMTKRNKAFKKHYKLYAFIYDSTDEIDQQADDYARELKFYFEDLPQSNRQVVIIGYSLGGLILRKAIADVDVDRLIHTVYSVAVPFHGSPMFDTHFTKYLRPPNHSPLRQLGDRFVFNAYMMGKGNLKRGLHWSNFDGSKPMYEKADLNGDMLVSTLYSYKEHPVTKQLKEKTIIYTSYLENRYTKASETNQLNHLIEVPFKLPKAVVGSILPIYGPSVHSVFSYMNYQLAGLPTYDPEHPKGVENHLYRYNDGVFPISSMLYLPSRNLPYQENLSELVRFIDVKKARVFLNLDHMHIGEYSWRKKRIRTEDVLHPEEGQRTPNEWLIHDLLKLAPELTSQ